MEGPSLRQILDIVQMRYVVVYGIHKIDEIWASKSKEWKECEESGGDPTELFWTGRKIKFHVFIGRLGLLLEDLLKYSPRSCEFEALRTEESLLLFFLYDHYTPTPWVPQCRRFKVKNPIKRTRMPFLRWFQSLIRSEMKPVKFFFNSH